MRTKYANAEEIGERIRKLRKAKYLSTPMIQKKASISASTMSAIERGIKTPSIPTLVKLSEILDCSTDLILTGEEHSKETPPVSFLECESERRMVNNYRLLNELDQTEIDEIILVKLRLKKKSTENLFTELPNIKKNTKTE